MPRRVAAVVAAWMLVVGTGTVLLTRYSLRPGGAADAPRLWPAGSRVPRAPGAARW